MSSPSAACPECGRTFRLPEKLTGRKLKCPACDASFSLSAAGEPSREPEPAGHDAPATAGVRRPGRWYFVPLALAPLGIPAITFGGVVPIVLGLSGLGVVAVLALISSWSTAVRVILSAGVVGFCYLGLLVVFVVKDLEKRQEVAANAKQPAAAPVAADAKQPEAAAAGVVPFDFPALEPLRGPAAGFSIARLKPEERCSSVVFSRDGSGLLAGSEKSMVYRWRVADGKPAAEYELGVDDRLWSIDVAGDDKTLAVGYHLGAVQLLDLVERKERNLYKGAGMVFHDLKFAKDGRTLYTRHETMRVWDVDQGVLREEPHTPGNSPWFIAMSPDGRLLAITYRDTFVGLYGHTDLKLIGECETEGARGYERRQGIAVVAFSPDSATFATGGGSGIVGLWDVKTRKRIGQPSPGSPVESIAFSADGRRVAAGSLGGEIRVWDARSFAPQPLRDDVQAPHFEPLAGGYTPASVAFSPDGTKLAVGRSNQVELWDLPKVLKP
jgi:WD40 repeat protein